MTVKKPCKRHTLTFKFIKLKPQHAEKHLVFFHLIKRDNVKSRQVSFIYIAPNHNKVILRHFTYRVGLDYTL